MRHAPKARFSFAWVHFVCFINGVFFHWILKETFGTASFWSSSTTGSLDQDDTQRLHEVVAERDWHRNRSSHWRGKAGSLACECRHVGPTGGFCVDPVAAGPVGAQDCLSKELAHNLGTYFGSASVGDFGCGFGQYGKYFKNHFPQLEWVGYDGSENIEVATHGLVNFLDLSEPQFLREFDWVMSVEVAEHLPGTLEANFVYFLIRHNRKGVVLTWALPNQQGHHHVNGQTNDYVTCVFTKVLGYEHAGAVEQQIRSQITNCAWLRNTVLVYSKPANFTPSAWELQARQIAKTYIGQGNQLLPSYLATVAQAGCNRANH